jgi:DNA-directed RNA polymerase
MAIQTLRNVNNAKHRLALEKADAEVEPEAEDSEDDFDQVESESSDGNSSGKSNRMPTFTVKHLLTAEGEPVVPEVVDGKKFVKLSDVLPACPPRGEFDINKIRNAPYFFS